MKKHKTSKLVCLALALCMLLSILPGTVMATGTAPEIKSPTTGNYLMVNEPVVIKVQSETAPTITVGETELGTPQALTDGLWAVTWTPTDAGVVTVKAENAAGRDLANYFVGAMIPTAKVFSTLTNGVSVALPETAADAAAVAIKFDATIEAGNVMKVYDANLVAQMTNLEATEALSGSVRIIVDKEGAVWASYFNGKQIGYGDLSAAADISEFLISGATVDESSVRGYQDANIEAAVEIISPVANTQHNEGAAVTVRAKTIALAAGQSVKIRDKSGAEFAATQVQGSQDEYEAIIPAATAATSGLYAVIESEDLISERLNLKIMGIIESEINSTNFNDWVSGTTKFPANFAGGWQPDAAATIVEIDAAHGKSWQQTTYKDFHFQIGSAYANKTDEYIIEADCYVGSTNGQVYVRLASQNSGYGNDTYDVLLTNSKVSVNQPTDAATTTVNVVDTNLTAAADGWHKIKVVAHGTTPTSYKKSVYVDGVPVAENVNVNHRLRTQLGSVNYVYRLYLETQNGAAIDNLAFKKGTPGELTYTGTDVGGGSGSQGGGGGGIVPPGPSAPPVPSVQGLTILNPVADTVYGIGDGVKVTVQAGDDVTGPITVSTNNGISAVATVKEGETNIYEAILSNLTANDTKIVATAGTVTSKEVPIAVLFMTQWEAYDFEGMAAGSQMDTPSFWGPITIPAVATVDAEHGTSLYPSTKVVWDTRKLTTSTSGEVIIDLEYYLPAGGVLQGYVIGNSGQEDQDVYITPTSVGSAFYDATATAQRGWKNYAYTQTTNAWHDLKIVVHLAKKTKSVFIDGECVIDRLPYNQKLIAASDAYVKRFGFLSSGNTYIDNINFRCSQASAPVSTMSLTNSNVVAGTVADNRPVASTITKIELVFSEAVTNRNLEGKIKLMRGDVEIPATIWADYETVEVIPTSVLQPNADYIVWIDEEIASTTGAMMKADATVTFSTAKEGSWATNSKVTLGGTELTGNEVLNAGTILTFEADLKSEAGTDAWIIFAVYHKNTDGVSALKESVTKKVTLAPNTDVSATADLRLTDAVGENDYIQAIVLDADKLLPLGDAIVLGK